LLAELNESGVSHEAIGNNLLDELVAKLGPQIPESHSSLIADGRQHREKGDMRGSLFA
jgi:hypothetical protein